MKTIIKSLLCNARAIAAVALTSCTLALFAAGGSVLKGRVTDKDNTPLKDAVVNVAEQSRIVLTDGNGGFTLKDVRADDEINVSAKGYHTRVVPVDRLDELMLVVLDRDTDLYAHERAVAFDKKPAKYMTESTSVVTGQELQRYPVTVLQNAFNSTLTGVETYEVSSEPGWSETVMYIRGVRTLNENARSPIVIVDDVERDISFLDAFPIETVTVLKDAAATALYGMRGANGVILVTTKRGLAGKTNINFTQEVGFQTLTGKVENQNSYNAALTRNRARYLDGRDPLYTAEQIEKYRRVCAGETLEGMDQYRYFNTNWFDELYRETAPVIKTNLQISGGNNRARYYVSFSYLRQEGMWDSKGTHFNDRFSTQHTLNRWNLRSNLDINVNKYLKVGLDLGGRIDNILQPTTSVFNLTTFGAVEADPMRPVYCPNGELYVDDNANNPIYMLGSSGQERNRRRQLYSTLNVNGDLSPITKGLGASLVVSFDAFDVFQSTQTNRVNSYSYDYTNAAVTDVSQFTYTQTNRYQELTNPSANERANSWTLNTRFGLDWQRNFGLNDIKVGAFVRYYQQRLNVREANTDNSQYSSDRYLSWNAFASYNFDGRYVLNANFSRMGNDNFAPGERWDNFWGVGAAWVISNEKFMRLAAVPLLKIRASYGRTGMSTTGAGRYPYQSTYAQSGGYGFGHNATWVPGYLESVAGNLNNKWEISKMVNVGLDWDFWNRRLYGSADFFKEWRSNILVSRTTNPEILGISFAKDSYGKVESKGVELTIGHFNKVGKVEYQIEGMLSWNTNRITEMDEPEPVVEWQRKTGKRIFDNASVASIYEWENRTVIGGWNQYRFDGWASDPSRIATSQEDAMKNPNKYPYNTFSGGNQKLGTAVFRDLNGDRQIDSRDMEPYGFTLIPELTPSISATVRYAGFDLKVVGTAYLNRSVFLSPSMTFSEWGSNNATHEVVNAWGYYTDDPLDPRNINAKYPRISYSYNTEDSSRDNGSYQNDIWVANGNYFSLRNIEFGYSLPERIISKAYMTQCRFYFSAYNVASISHMPKGMDPEKPMSYCWWYPKTRIFSFGVNVSF